MFGLFGMVLSLNYNVLERIKSKISNIGLLSFYSSCFNNIEKDDKTYIIFCFDENDDEKRIFLKNYLKQIDELGFLTNEQKEILKNIHGIINNKVNNKSTGPNGAKNGVISYFINSDLFDDFSILHFVDDDDISISTKQIRKYINGITNYVYSSCYKNDKLYKEYRDIYGLHELFITKQFIKNIPLLRYGVMNKEDLDYRSRLFYINYKNDFINTPLYRYFTHLTIKSYKSDNEDLLTFEITNFMNYELDIAGKLKIEYKNKSIEFPKEIYNIYAPVCDPFNICFGNNFINTISDKEKYITYLKCCAFSNMTKDFRREKVHIPIKNDLYNEILNINENDLTKYKLKNGSETDILLNDFVISLLKRLRADVYICYYYKNNNTNNQMFASSFKNYYKTDDDFVCFNLSDGTTFYNLLNTTFEYSILYPNNGNEENTIYKYILKQNEEGNKIKGGFNDVLQNIILLLRQLILIITILIIIVIMVFLIKCRQKNINK